jgi:hypothetical protein
MAILRIASICGVICAGALGACSSGKSTTGTDASGSTGDMGGAGTGGSGGASFEPGPHAPLPQVADLGGPVLTKPKVQPFVYASDPQLSSMTDFLSWISTSSYWTATTQQYGVGALTILPPIMLPTPQPATLSDADLQGLIGTLVTGTPDPGTIYLFVLPPATIESDSGGSCCQDYDGYHDEATVGSVTVPYALSCACTNMFDGPGVDDLQQRTVNASHELIEASTDPFPDDNAAWVQEDNDDLIWSFISGGELADMCEFNSDTYLVPVGSKYMVQRSWSNAAAKMSQNPCVPYGTTAPYFNTTAVLSDTIEVPTETRTGGTEMVASKGLKLASGGTTTIDLQLFSDAPTSGPWKVSVYDANYLLTGDQASANLELTLDKDTGENGDTLHLTVTAKSYDPNFGEWQGFDAAGFFIFSDLGTEENLSMGLVSPN